MNQSSRSKENRRQAILDAGSRLFRVHSIEAVSIDQIVKEAGIAKGTFYLYFTSKHDLLAQLAASIVGDMAGQARAFIDETDLRPDDQLAAVLSILKQVELQEFHVQEALERPDNHELHEQANIEMVRQIGPILAEVVDRGKEEGLFVVQDSLSTIQFILAGQAFLLGDERFGWNEEEQFTRLMATLTLVERALGAEPNSLSLKMANALKKLM